MQNAKALQASSRNEILKSFRKPWWLQSAHGDPSFVAKFDGEPSIELNFNVPLANGRPIPKAANGTLLCEIYDFLAIQGSEAISRRAGPRGPKAERNKVVIALRLVDYFLLNETEKLARYGFSAIGKHQIVELLVSLQRNASISEAIYDWKNRLSSYTNSLAEKLTNEELAEQLQRYPKIKEVDIPKTDWQLNIPDEETLIKIRASLMRDKRYTAYDSQRPLSPFIHNVNSTHLAQEVLKGCVWALQSSAATRLENFEELSFGTGERSHREMDGAPCRIGDEVEGLKKRTLLNYRNTLYNWLPLSRLGIGIPEAELAAAELEWSIDGLRGPLNYGVNPLPPPVFAHLLSNAIAFFYDQVPHIFESYKAVSIACRVGSCRPDDLERQDKFLGLLPSRARNMGISVWSRFADLKSTRKGQPVIKEYYEMLRSGRGGLHDYLLVANGACQVITGALQATRQAELQGICRSHVEFESNWLAVFTGKSGFDQIRHKEFLPMPQVVADVFASLSGLSDGNDTSQVPLLSVVNASGQLGMSTYLTNAALDMFCDYCEAPLDKLGRRHYVRHHQLRNFFASAFFCCFSFAGLEVLRWFMRHINAQHLYAYICTQVPGEVLRRYKAVAAAAAIREGATEVDALLRFLRRNYGVSRFDMLTSDELASLITDLQQKQRVSIEPIFPPSDWSEPIRLAVVIWE